MKYIGFKNQKENKQNSDKINICLILSTIYSFILVSGCVGINPSALLCPRDYNALKTALSTRVITI